MRLQISKVIFVGAFLVNHDAVLRWLNTYGMSLKVISPLPGVTFETLDRGREVLKLAKEVEQSLPQEQRATLADNSKQLKASLAKLESDVLASPAAKKVTDWAIVASGFSSLEDATKEVALLRESAMQAGIFKKRSSYRVVVTVAEKADPSDILKAVSSLRPDSYLVRLDKWCGENRMRESDFVSCPNQ